MKKYLFLISLCISTISTATTITPAPAPAATTITAPATATAANPYAKYLIPNAPDIDAAAYYLVDVNSGVVLASKEPDTRRQPASLTKLMTVYLVFKELAAGHLQLRDNVTISKNAWQTGGSRMFVKVGDQVAVEDLLQGIVVASGNDATTALAEHLGGTEPVFVQMMDQQAKMLGMSNTNYADATGLPNPDNYSTPHDLSILATAVITDFPQYYHYFSEKWFTWNGIRQPNRNRLLWRNDNVDGLKTGHTDEAGYCLIASAVQNGSRLVAVVMGAPSDNARANDTEALLKYGFRFYETKLVYSANQTITQARVWGGKEKMVNIGVAKNFYITVPNGAYKDLKLDTVLNSTIDAPVQVGQQLGTIQVSLNGQVIETRPLVALQANPKAGVFGRFIDWLRRKI